jgi:hypothetical protein
MGPVAWQDWDEIEVEVGLDQELEAAYEVEVVAGFGREPNQ